MALFSLSATFLSPPASVAAPDNKTIGSLVVARLVSQRRLAPGGLRLTADRRTALAAAMRMVARIHDRASHGWTPPHVARAPGLADAAVLMVDIPHLADGGRAEDMHAALLARRQAHQGIIALFGHQLCPSPGPAHQLAAPAFR